MLRQPRRATTIPASGPEEMSIGNSSVATNLLKMLMPEDDANLSCTEALTTQEAL
jgi:hypothetical protein